MEPLTPEQARVLGCLVEKAMTTPEYYPLTVNALVAACNQKTNRDPVVAYDDDLVQRVVLELDEKGLVGPTRATGGRTVKYAHRAETVLEVDDQQLALLAVLLLRGPQTPGELRTRTDRYTQFEDVAAVEEILTGLVHRNIPLVERLERLPGQKENRYRTLVTEAALSPSAGIASNEQQSEAAVAGMWGDGDLVRRIEELERRVARLEDGLGLTTRRLVAE